MVAGVCCWVVLLWLQWFVVGLQVCLAAVGLVCDLCRALQSNMLPYCDEIMQLLLENLGVRKTTLLHHVVVDQLIGNDHMLSLLQSRPLTSCWTQGCQKILIHRSIVIF